MEEQIKEEQNVEQPKKEKPKGIKDYKGSF